jgi:hypothetical protein
LSFVICVMGFTELSERAGIVPMSAVDSEAIRKAKWLEILPGPQRDVVNTLVDSVSGRSDISTELQEYINDWRSKRQMMFAPTARTEFFNHKHAFSGLKENVE